MDVIKEAHKETKVDVPTFGGKLGGKELIDLIKALHAYFKYKKYDEKKLRFPKQN